MAPTEGRVARPERQWGCRRGTPMAIWRQTDEQTDSSITQSPLLPHEQIKPSKSQ